jgi:hypothetical protein
MGMHLMVEFQDEHAARQALRELKASGFSDDVLGVTHPFEGGVVVTVEAVGDELPVAFEVLSRHEAAAATDGSIGRSSAGIA